MDASTDSEPIELNRFELVLLKRPKSSTNLSEAEIDRLQELHVAHLDSLVQSGDILVAGPFDEQSDVTLRGMCIYQTGSLERTRALANSDPSVLAGRLDVDVMYFYCPKGQM